MSGTDPVDPATGRLLDDPAVWAEVPSSLRARTLAAALGGVGEPVVALGRRPVWRRPGVLAAAAVIVVGLVAAVGLGLRGDSGPDGVEVALAGTEAMPDASATVHLRNEPAGVAVVLQVNGLPPAPEGSFYEAWLVGPNGKVSAGTFHQRGNQDEIQLWLGVDTAGYDALTLTRQPVAGGTTADGVVVLRGELPDS